MSEQFLFSFRSSELSQSTWSTFLLVREANEVPYGRSSNVFAGYGPGAYCRDELQLWRRKLRSYSYARVHPCIRSGIRLCVK